MGLKVLLEVKNLKLSKVNPAIQIPGYWCYMVESCCPNWHNRKKDESWLSSEIEMANWLSHFLGRSVVKIHVKCFSQLAILPLGTVDGPTNNVFIFSHQRPLLLSSFLFLGLCLFRLHMHHTIYPQFYYWKVSEWKVLTAHIWISPKYVRVVVHLRQKFLCHS